MPPSFPPSVSPLLWQVLTLVHPWCSLLHPSSRFHPPPPPYSLPSQLRTPTNASFSPPSAAALQLLTHPFILKHKDEAVDLAAYIQNVVNPTERLKDLSNVRPFAAPLQHSPTRAAAGSWLIEHAPITHFSIMARRSCTYHALQHHGSKIMHLSRTAASCLVDHAPITHCSIMPRRPCTYHALQHHGSPIRPHVQRHGWPTRRCLWAGSKASDANRRTNGLSVHRKKIRGAFRCWLQSQRL